VKYDDGGSIPKAGILLVVRGSLLIYGAEKVEVNK
jgi:hypothetical protein